MTEKLKSRVRNQTQDLRRYNLTPEAFEDMLELQEFACAICLEPERRKRSDGTEVRLSIDHCHKTEARTGRMRVRGLLCSECNMALGLLRDSVPNLRRAIEYLGPEYDYEDDEDC